MTRQLDQSEAAVQDIIELATYMAGKAGIKTANRFVKADRHAYERVADNPGIGSAREYSPDFINLRM
jgi:plasmid stabilization system protein ParE